MKNYLILIIIIISSCKTYSQDKSISDRLVNSFNAEMQLGSGGGYIGVMGRANHWWFEKGNLKFQSGVSLNLFYASENLDEGSSQTFGYNLDNHLRFHTGIEQSIFKKERIYVFFDMYGGVYNIFTSGNYKNSELNIDREYKNNEFIWDYGSSLGFGYRIKEKWGIQLSMTNSWRAINEFGSIGLIIGQPDAKFSLGIGVNYRL